MSEYDRDREELNLDEALQGLGDIIHVPSEVILAYAEGRLAQSAEESVAKHIEKCDECKQVFRLATEFAASEGISAPVGDSTHVPSMGDRLAAKVAIHTHLSTKRDAIAEKVAGLFVEAEMAFVIRPAIVALRNLKEPLSQANSVAKEKLRAAAFSSGWDQNTERAMSIVGHVLVFLDAVCSELMARCSSIGEIAAELESCIDESVPYLSLELDENHRRILVIMLSESFSGSDSEGAS